MKLFPQVVTSKLCCVLLTFVFFLTACSTANHVVPGQPLPANQIALAPPMPILRAYTSAVAENNRFYLLGGMDLDEGKFFNNLEVYDYVSNQWETMAPMPHSRSMAASVLLDGKIYVFGGRNEDGIVTAIDIFDIATGVWSSPGEMPYQAWDLMAEAANGKIYLIGGISGIGDDRTALDTVSIYDPSSGAWEITSSLLSPRHGSASAVIDGKIYILGGKEQTGSAGQSTDKVEVLDTSTMEWKSLPPLPIRKVGMKGTAVAGKIYTAGGNSGSSIYNTIDCYDPESGILTQVATLTRPRVSAEIESSGDLLFIAGGMLDLDMNFTDMLELIKIGE